jgi:hypothetical protein
MKKIISFILFFTLFTIGQSFSQFTSGNIVVVRIGDGVTPLSNASAPVFLDEYTTSGELVQSISLPTSVNGSNYRFVNSGSANSEGALTLSPDKLYLCLAGYDTTVSIVGIVAAAGIDRVIARVDYLGNINTATKIPQTNGYNTNNIRGAVTYDGTAFWTSGTASTGSLGGVRYITLGSTSGTSIQLSSTPTNIRCVNIFNSQLYVTSASGTFQGVSSIGTGLPTTTGQTTTLLSGFPTTAGPSSYGFSINSSGDVIYVADDRASAFGGIQKWTLISGTWTLQYTLNPSTNIGCRGITVEWSGANPVIYETGTDSKIYAVTDIGSGSVASVIATAGLNKVFRGIAFAPTAPAIFNLGLTALLSGNYNGTTMVPKKVLVELHNSITPYALVDSQTVLLNASGSGNPVFTKAANGTSYYIVLKFDNGLETWSAAPQTFSGSVLNYDFTIDATQAYGNNMLLVGTKWCVISGDANQDASVDALDRSACWNDRNLSGVYASDLNGDGTVDALDRSIAWNNRNLSVQKPALIASPGVKQNDKGINNNTKGTYDLKLDGSNSKKVKKNK